MARITKHRDGAQIERASRLDRQHDAGHRDVRMEYTKDSNVNREAHSLSDSARGGTGDANAGKSMKRVSSQQASPFSRAAQLPDMGRRGSPDDEVMP